MESGNRSDDPLKASFRAPFGVIVAEVFLVFILMIYFAKLGVLMMGLLSEDASEQLDLLGWNFIFYFVEIALFFLSLVGLFGLSSRRPSGWRNAARATVILLFMTVWATVLGRTMSLTSIVTFRLDQVIPLVVIVLIAVMLPSVRRWYIPPMMESRPLPAWIRYMVSGDLYPKGTYRIAYPEPREETIEVEPQRPGLFGFIGSFMRRLRPAPQMLCDPVGSDAAAHGPLVPVIGPMRISPTSADDILWTAMHPSRI